MNNEKKVLIIDDDSRNIFAMNAILKSKKFNCDAAFNASEGLAKMQHNSYAVVLMDMMMPDMDGYEAMEMMRNDSRLKNIPVIAVTAQAMPGDKEKCLKAGAVAYITKPVNIDELTRLMDNLMNSDARHN